MDVTILVPWGREDVTAMLHRNAEVISEDAREDGTIVHARVGEREFADRGALPRRTVRRPRSRRRLTSRADDPALG
jgi:hypothetical protein